MAIEILQIIHPWCEEKEFGKVKAATREVRRRPNGLFFRLLQEQQEAKPQIRAKSTSTIVMLEPKIGSCTISNQTQSVCGFVNYQTQHQANFVHQPAKVTQMISNMDPSRIESISVTYRSKQVHQLQHNHGLKDQANFGRIIVRSTDKIRGIKQIISLRGGSVPESFPRSPFSVVAALLPRAQQTAKRSHTFTDEASKYTGVSPKSNPEGKRVLALASLRHQNRAHR